MHMRERVFGQSPIQHERAGLYWQLHWLWPHRQPSLSAVLCPANAAGAPACACNAGFSPGQLGFNLGSQAYTGSCSRLSTFPHLNRSCFMSFECQRRPSVQLQCRLFRRAVVQLGWSHMEWHLQWYRCGLLIDMQLLHAHPTLSERHRARAWQGTLLALCRST